MIHGEFINREINFTRTSLPVKHHYEICVLPVSCTASRINRLPQRVNWKMFPRCEYPEFENMLSTNKILSRVLLLGAGFVTKPTLEILSDDGIHVTVG